MVFLYEVEDKYCCVLTSSRLIHMYCRRKPWKEKKCMFILTVDFLTAVNFAKFWLHWDLQICPLVRRNPCYCLFFFGHKCCPGDFSVSPPAGSLAELQDFLAQGFFLLCAIKYGNVYILWILLKLVAPELTPPKRTCRSLSWKNQI